MHELPIDECMIRRLLSEQAAQWANLPFHPVASTGTDNALFRLGEKLLLRIPRRVSAIPLVSKELDWLPHLSSLPLDVPNLRFRGCADFGTRCQFGVFDWLEGEIATLERIADPVAAAMSLAGFLVALHGKDMNGAPRAGELNNRRGIPLEELTDITIPAIEIVADEIDASRARAIWDQACCQPHARSQVWLHGDLKADNLLTQNGQLSSVIDWGLAAVGDPAADYAAAWSWIDPSARQVFRETCGMDDSDWLRAKGWALYGAVIALYGRQK